MVGGAARAAIFAVIIALVSVCVSIAQTPVSLVDMRAERTATGVSIELVTSGPADFRIDRFALGDWIYIWSPLLEATVEEQDLPLDFAELGLSEYVTRASLASDGRRNGIRLYVGSEGNRRTVAFASTPTGAVLKIPARPISLRERRGAVGDPMKLVQPKQLDAADAERPVLVSNQRGKGAIDFQLNVQTPPAGTDDLPVIGPGTRQDDHAEDSADPLPMRPGTSGDSTRPAPRTAAPITTSRNSFQSQFLPEAQVSISTSPRLPAGGDGKAELSRVMIDLFEIVDQPLDQALTLLVAPTRYNIIVDAEVGTNRVSLSFKESQTDLRSALDALTRVYGLEYVVEAGTIIVAPADKMRGQMIPWQSRLFVLSYADPRMVRDMLINTAIVPADQIEFYGGETTFPQFNDQTTLSDSDGVSVDQIKAIETNVSSTPRNAVLVRGMSDQLDRIALVIANLDRKPKQIQLEVRVCEANEVAMRNLGVQASTQISQLFNEIGFENPDNGDIFFEANQLGSMNRTGGLNFEARLNAEQSAGNVTILAQPTLTTTEGKQAIFFAGESVPYISRPAVAQGSNFQPAQVDFIKVGVILNFKPRLDRDGLMTIDMNPTVSSVLEFLDLGGGASAPRTQSRQLANTIRVVDGQTFAMSGLISEEERSTTTKIPLLGDIPLVGKLFRSKHKQKSRTEIIVLVTPHILD